MNLHDPDREDTTIYKVVVNHEEQYSIWPEHKEMPLGWNEVGKSGPKPECLSYIKDVWTDMRPLSLRKQMEEAAKMPTPELTPTRADGSSQSQGDDLVNSLLRGEHPITASLRPAMTARILKDRIDSGYVHLKFTATRGGTELGIRLDQEAIDLSQADFENQTGTVHLEGLLTLNFVRVRCLADLDLQTLTGKGHLALA
jgi:uncharacterized protein YbdZ (MbtH family)